VTFDPAAAVAAYHTDLESRDLAAIESWFADAASYQSRGLGHLHGRIAILTALSAYFASNPNHAAQDQSIHRISEYTAESQWSLTTGSVQRQGVETVTFDQFGKITSIIVIDT
jgi:limonene-1,2-epoxide hydrolase